LDRDLRATLDFADEARSEMSDDFLSIEHVLLGLMKGGGSGNKLLVGAGATVEGLKNSLREVRGTQTVTDENPEGKYQTLEKYGTDLCALAREGKIDPVIGRDEEVRRVMQVLSRRTKKQSRIDWGARHRQDSHCRRTCPENRRRRCPGFDEE
jgi:ATP-dependent Clp protease ATP-binding subunit ClpB